MKTRFSIFILLFALQATSALFAQYSTIDETTAYINDRLSHSVLQKVAPDGMVTINSPGNRYKFPLSKASFNYNGANNDDRVRVFCDNCIEKYENKVLDERLSRQSFACESEQEANEVIAAFRFLKSKFKSSDSQPQADKKLNLGKANPGYTTVSEAIDFINSNLSYSMIIASDPGGFLTMNAPDDIYTVDVKKAEFNYNRSSDEPKVRIYGDFVITKNKGKSDEEALTRQSFTAPTRDKAFAVIEAFYYLKATLGTLDPAKIPTLNNVSKVKTTKYINVDEAIDFINDRLAYSMILSVDKAGNMIINSPDDIYSFNLHKVKYSKTNRRSDQNDWFPFVTSSSFAPGVMVECNNCIRKSDEPGSTDSEDEQVFQCDSPKDAAEVIKALDYIKSFTGK